MKCALATLLVLGVAVAGCGDLASMLSGAGFGAAAPGGGGRSGATADNTGQEAGGTLPGQTLPTSGVVSARVRNFTDLSADVTLRFLLKDVVVHLSFLRVPGHTSTTVVGPDVAEQLVASGVNQNGEPLPEVIFEYGRDFSEGTEAVYIIGNELSADNIPPTIVFVQPIANVQIPQGGELQVAIADEDPDSAAAFDLYLDPNDQPLDGDEIVLAAGVAEDPDGAEDAFSFTLANDLPIGIYRLVAVISDELSTDIVQAPGLVEVVPAGAENGGGEQEEEEEEESIVLLELLEPAEDVEVGTEGSFTATWTGEASDQNALIAFYLDPGDGTIDGNELLIASGLPLAPGGGQGSVELLATGAEPGTYRLLGVLASADGSALAAAPGRVIVLPTGKEPGLIILEPHVNVALHLGESLYTTWRDADDDSNATITFYLDPNSVDLDGGEIWIAEFKEDPDGPDDDQASIPIVNLAPGTYELLGVIFDGVLSDTARADGLVTVLSNSDTGGSDGFTDCQPNGIPDYQELEGNDCNTNSVPDDCDIAAQTSADLNTDGIPDECQLSLGGYWRFDFHADMACDYFEDFTHEVRYLYFDQDSQVTESWILTSGWALDQNQAYLRLNYPSTQGPSYTEYRQYTLTEDTARTTGLEWLDTRGSVFRIVETVDSAEGGEDGATTFSGMPNGAVEVPGGILWTGLEGAWEFENEDETRVCGQFTAERVDLPPDLPAVIDLEPVALSLSTTDLASPGVVQVTDRAYKVRYSFLTEPATVKYYLSLGGRPNVELDELLGSEQVGPGMDGTLGSHNGAGPALNIPAGLDLSCDALFVIVIDPDEELVETNEDNNVFTVAVTVSPDGNPDCGTNGLHP